MLILILILNSFTTFAQTSDSGGTVIGSGGGVFVNRVNGKVQDAVFQDLYEGESIFCWGLHYDQSKLMSLADLETRTTERLKEVWPNILKKHELESKYFDTHVVSVPEAQGKVPTPMDQTHCIDHPTYAFEGLYNFTNTGIIQRAEEKWKALEASSLARHASKEHEIFYKILRPRNTNSDFAREVNAKIMSDEVSWANVKEDLKKKLKPYSLYTKYRFVNGYTHGVNKDEHTPMTKDIELDFYVKYINENKITVSELKHNNTWDLKVQSSCESELCYHGSTTYANKIADDFTVRIDNESKNLIFDRKVTYDGGSFIFEPHYHYECEGEF